MLETVVIRIIDEIPAMALVYLLNTTKGGVELILFTLLTTFLSHAGTKVSPKAWFSPFYSIFLQSSLPPPFSNDCEPTFLFYYSLNVFSAT